MPKPFKPLTLEEFSTLLDSFRFARTINAVHMHHTWRPDHGQYKGLATIEAMWQNHTQQRKWSDIAQHITIAPDGTIWTGRNWNQPPASASGHNGNRQAGPFMFEIIGNFDMGHDPFAGRQREVVIEVIARVQQRFALAAESLVFHNQMTNQKSCPGTGIDRAEILMDVGNKRRELDQAREDHESADHARGISPAQLTRDYRAIDAIADELGAALPTRDDPADAELSEQSQATGAVSDGIASMPQTRSARSTHDRLTPEILHAMRPHVVNLSMGSFSSSGVYQTTPADVDAIFADHLPRALADAKQRGKKLRVVVVAHGGLVSEVCGLWGAHQMVGWWRSNHIYPIHIVWETGLLETVGQLLRGRLHDGVGTRGFADHFTDPLLEFLARSIGGGKIWSGMKYSAERAFATDGGGKYLVDGLAAFHAAHDGDYELHAVGHSAGSIFHAHMIPAAIEAGAAPFRTVHFLAPAIRVDTFKERLMGRIGNGVERLSIFTMAKDLELNDTCMELYRKSLLYLIHNALEPKAETPILGLQESLRGDRELARLFGLDGTNAQHADVVFSTPPGSDRQEQADGRGSSHAMRHGDFDNDKATMDSVVRRILDSDSITELPVIEECSGALDGLGSPFTRSIDGLCEPDDAMPFEARVAAAAISRSMAEPRQRREGRRRALCIGIDRYPDPEARLAGCVADARLWAETFAQIGFEQPELLLDGQATRQGILNRLTAMIADSAPGDIIAFQYAGHGTHVPDVNDDEDDRIDEAICSYDYADGRMVIDDDLAEIFDAIPEGVNVTCFMDCCHSGTNTRLVRLGAARTGAKGAGQRARSLTLKPEAITAHIAFRTMQGARPRRRGDDSYSTAREILFAACSPIQSAMESDGHGHFTLCATSILRRGIDGLTNQGLHRAVLDAFGATTAQSPELHCMPLLMTAGFLAAHVDGDNGAKDSMPAGAPAALTSTERRTVASLLRSAVALLDGKE